MYAKYRTELTERLQPHTSEDLVIFKPIYTTEQKCYCQFSKLFLRALACAVQYSKVSSHMRLSRVYIILHIGYDWARMPMHTHAHAHIHTHVCTHAHTLILLVNLP